VTGTAGVVLEAVWPGLAAGALATVLLPWLQRGWRAARVMLLTASVVLILRYVLWRGLATIPAPAFTLDFLAGLVFYRVETITLVGVIINLFLLSRVRDRSPEADRNGDWLRSLSPPPLVDVLICTCNEQREIVERTIIGARAMRYPAFRLWVCDDGRRPWLKDLCAELGCGYITRFDNRHAKAGNINNALGVIGNLAERPQFISILDADFVPRATFLDRTLPLFRDPHIGIVQTPQHFINPDPIQSNLSATGAWPDEQRFFFDVVMAAKDAWGLAFCCGTSSVIRYGPLAAMGGFPTDSVTEDYLVTLRMKERGHGTAYLNEALTLGLAPEGLKEYITQRGRWCLGFIQICRGRSGPLSRWSPLPLLDRISLVEGFISWGFAYAYRLLGIVVPIAYLLFGIKVVEADLGNLLHHFLPFFVWNTMVANWIAQGRIMPVMTDVCQLLAAPTVLKSVAAGMLYPKNQRFNVTAKGGDRASRFVEWPLMRLFLLLLLLTFDGLASTWLSDDRLADGGAGLMAIVWSWYNILVLTVAAFVCIETPRLRRAERFAASERVTVDFGAGLSRITVLADISIVGARLLGPAPAGPGERVRLRVPGLTVAGEIVRATAEDFALRLDDDAATRAAMIRFIYARPYHQEFRTVNPRLLGLAVARRLFR
jgi:cellulose synthase (UDP-forming)